MPNNRNPRKTKRASIANQRASFSPPPPVTPAPERLPLDDPNLPWDRFEAFCRDLISSLPDVVHCYHYGQQGSKQKGIDLIAERSDGSKWVYQCKQYRAYTKKQVDKAISETTYQANKYHLVLSCEVGAPIRDAGSQAKWEVWDVRDLSQKVRELDVTTKRRLIEAHFGSAWRQAFLHLGPSLFQTQDEFFRPWNNPDRLFHHVWQLVGRETLLAEMARFVQEDRQRAFVLAGRGGIGKSKVLHAFATDFSAQHPAFSLYFLDPGLPLTTEVLNDLPDHPSVIVIDDAHRRDDLSAFLSTICRRNIATKIVLATRPHGIASILADLRDAGYASEEIIRPPEVVKLSLDDVEALARQALGPVYSGYTERLAQLTADCPLVTVVGGKLLAERQVSPHLLERNEDFRFTVLNRFEDILIGQVGGAVEPVFCRNLLQALTIIAPFRDNKQAYAEAGAQFLETTPDGLRQALGHLEATGVLLRRGYSLRITPDVLADHILHNACLSPSGQPTGYARRIFEAFGSVCPADVLRNLAELDWRQRQGGREAPDVLADIWPEIEEQFRSAPHSLRCHILDLLEEVAVFQPARVLALVDLAMHEPSNTTEDERAVLFYPYTQADVLRRLPKLLQHIGYNLDFLPYCSDLLWQLGQDDSRELNPHPDHALRILQRFAEYDTDKPLKVNELMVEAVARWLKEPDAHEHRYSPLDVLDPLFKKEGHSDRSQGHSLIMSPFLVSAQNTKELREQAFRLVTECAKSPCLRVVVRAVESLDKALAQPHGLMGMVVPEEVYAEWEPEQLAILDRLHNIVAQAGDPLVCLKVADSIRWEARHSVASAVRDRAKEIIASVSDTFALRFTRALVQNHGRDFEPVEDEDWSEAYRRHGLEQRAMWQALAAEFLQQFPTAKAGAAALRERIRTIEDSGVKIHAGEFVHLLAQGDAHYSAAVCEELIDIPDMVSAVLLPAFLTAVRAHDASQAVALAEKAVGTNDVMLCRAVAYSYTYPGWSDAPLDEELALLHALATHADAVVRLHMVGAVRVLGTNQPQEAVELALLIEVSDDPKVAEELCGCLGRMEGLSIGVLQDEQLDNLLTRLVPLPNLDDYHMNEFLNNSAMRRPRQVIEMLLQRVQFVEQIERGEGTRYSPLPTTGFHEPLTNLAECDEYSDLLRLIRDDILRETWQARFWLPHLFREASLRYTPASLQVLEEWINSGDTQKITLAGCLFQEAPKGYLFSNIPFVVSLLRRAHKAGSKPYQHAASYLWHIAISGVRMGMPGQPMPEDVSMRDQARNVMEQLPAGSPEYRFYEDLVKHADASIRDQLAEDEELEA